MADSVLDKLAKSKAATTAKYLEPGAKYMLEIQAIKLNNGFKGNFAIAEMKVLGFELLDPNAKPTPIGSSASHVENLDKNDANGGGRFKALLMAVTDQGEDAFATLEQLSKYFSDKQPCAFLRVYAETFMSTIKGGANAGKPIVKTRFSPVETTAEMVQEIEAKRAAAKLPMLAEAFAG